MRILVLFGLLSAMPLMASSVALAEFSGVVGESSGWRCVSSETGKVVYIPFEGYYESKGGRVESPRFKLGGETGKNNFYRLKFSAKNPVDGYWWVDFFDKDGNQLPDVNSRLYASEDWQPYDVMVPARPDAVFGQIAFVTKKGALARDVTFRHASVAEAARWCDNLATTLPQLNPGVPSDAWMRLPKTRERLLFGGPLNIVFLGDSIMNDTWCGNVAALLQNDYPYSDLRCIISVRGSTGCWYYHEAGNFVEYVAKYHPDLVVIGGISNYQIKQQKRYKDNRALVEEDMVETIERCKKLGAEVIVCTPPKSVEFRKTSKARPLPADLTDEATAPDYLQQAFERRAASRTGVQIWDLTFPTCTAVSLSGKPIGWFDRDAVHNDDRGKQLIAQTLRAYFRAASDSAEKGTLHYAACEARRLLKRIGVNAKVECSEMPKGLIVSPEGDFMPSLPSTAAVRFDGYAIKVENGAYAIAAKEEKGVLNGLYALAEKLGFAFVEPGKSGERAPSALARLSDGEWTENPRFKYRGIFVGSPSVRFPVRERYAFYAKIRFNAMTSHSEAEAIPEEGFAKLVGLRLETGGHGMSACLPRDLFDKTPELFRMFQPEDFGGKRMKDANFCPTNPKTRRIVKANFRKKVEIAAAHGYHALHSWADDLPGGGWCMCSRCRALLGTDQSQYVMNLEAQAVREAGVDMRVPVIAYHDTMFPSETIDPDPLCYYLFAPRERCYAHALNDSSCALNRHYHSALKAWAARYCGIDDSHTFEYYNDKILFRGHTPYLPDVILGDGDAYEAAGVESWMSLQVGGEALAPDWNMLAHAVVAWESGLTREMLTQLLAERVGGSAAKSWYTYLNRRAGAYEKAWQVCDVPVGVYFDYRFMPERPGKSGGMEMVLNLREGNLELLRARDELLTGEGFDEFSKFHVDRESQRVAFEAKDMEAMSVHQSALTAIADSWNGLFREGADSARVNFGKACNMLKEASALHDVAAKGFETMQYYPIFALKWSLPEITNKINIYSGDGAFCHGSKLNE